MLSKILILVCGFLAIAVLYAPAASAGQANDVLFGACQNAPDSTACQDKNTDKNPAVKAINVIANGFAIAGGVVAVIMIIISGFKFVTGGGIAGGQRSSDPSAIRSARATLTASIIGLLVIVFAWLLVHFVAIRIIQ